MKTVVQIENFAEIDKINDFIHDCYFEIENINFNEKLNILSVLFNKLDRNERELIKKGIIIKKYRTPEYQCSIKLWDVNKFSQRIKNDSEKWDLFNKISIRDEEVILWGQISVDIILCINKLNIQIEKMEFPIRYLEKWAIF